MKTKASKWALASDAYKAGYRAGSGYPKAMRTVDLALHLQEKWQDANDINDTSPQAAVDFAQGMKDAV